MFRREYLLAIATFCTGCLRLTPTGTPPNTSSTHLTQTQSVSSTATSVQKAVSSTATPVQKAVPTAMTKEWSFNGGVSGFVKRQGDRLYAAGWGSIYAFDLSGTKQWTFSVGPEEVTLYGVDVDSTRVYAGTDRGNVYAINRRTGKQSWRSSLAKDANTRSAPIVAGRTLILNTQDPAGYVGLSTHTGDQRWRFDSDIITVQGDLRPGTVASDPLRAYLRDGAQLYCVAPATGEVIWQTEKFKYNVNAPPTIANNTLYASDAKDNGGVIALNATTGKKRWTSKTLGPPKTQPAVDGRRVFIGSNDNSVYAFRAGDGLRLWQYQTGDDIHDSPVIHRGFLYIASSDGNLYVFNPETGDVVFKKNINAELYTEPVIVDEWFYRVNGTDLNAYQLSLKAQS